MTKNQKGGKHKHMKKGNVPRKANMNTIPTPADYGDASVFIGIVTSILGGCRFKIRSMDTDTISSTETIAWLRASKARGPRVIIGTIVLYALRDYESRDNDSMKADIEYVYIPEEIDILKQLELIPQNYESAVDQSKIIGEISDDGFMFTRSDNITDQEIQEL
jgi:hypothetical protein